MKSLILNRGWISLASLLAATLGGCAPDGADTPDTGDHDVSLRAVVIAPAAGVEDLAITSHAPGNGHTERTGDRLPVHIQPDYETRAILRFAIRRTRDDGTGVPAGATIRRATLTLAVETWDASFNLRLAYLQAPWNPEAVGWRTRDLGLSWASPGGSGAGTDRASAAEHVIGGFDQVVNVRTIELHPAMVQSWLDDPSTNQGLQVRNDTPGRVGRIFASEVADPLLRPSLQIEYDDTTRADLTPPSSTLTSPTAGTQRGTLALAATAADAGGITRVQFRVDGRVVATDNRAPYAYDLDTTTLRNGDHVITAHARDTAGNVGVSAGVRITLDNPVIDAEAPQIAITSPVRNETVSGSVAVRFDASDDVAVAGIQLRVDGQPVGAEITGEPWAVSLDTTAIALGSHQLTAVARDAAGRSTTAAAVAITVVPPPPDTTAPTAAIAAPTAGATVRGSVDVTVAANDNVGVVGVQLRVDDRAVGAEDTSYPYIVRVDTLALGNGPHVLTAVARDAVGQTGASTAVAITVDNPPPVRLDIPAAHPRLWLTPARLEAARSRFQRSPYTVPVVDGPQRAIDAALRAQITGETASCRAAIEWAKTITFTLEGVASDGARWNGEAVILTFDWCFAQLTADEVTLLRDRWNQYIQVLNDKPWGGPGYEGNNYYTGYFRNTILWAIASWHENQPQADGFLQYAINDRWHTGLEPYLANDARGGAPHEGSTYGRRTMAYMTVPLTSLALLGLDLWNRTSYFLETVFFTIYSTTPGPTNVRVGNTTYALYETFPFNDDERWLERYPSNNTAQTTLGGYLAPLIDLWRDQPVAGYARRFLQQTGATIDERHVDYVYGDAVSTVAPRDLATLPLDYHAAGLGALYARTGWTGADSALSLQYAPPTHVGHVHKDAGSFQLWRGGEFLARETVGYDSEQHSIVGYGGNGAVGCSEALAHNTLLFNGKGQVGYFLGKPTLLRMASTAQLSYSAVDLTSAYDLQPDWQHREDEPGVGNPAAGRVVRETLFVRPLDALVVFDRVESGRNDASVTKTFVMHFETSPTEQNGRLAMTRGNQELQLATLAPANATRRVVDERGARRPDGSYPYRIGQFRAEIETSGQVASHFLHVLHARDAGSAALGLSVDESATSYTLTLTHPTRGTAVVVLQKGITSTGGAFGFATSGTPVPTPLRADVQAMSVTPSGPVWGP